MRLSNLHGFIVVDLATRLVLDTVLLPDAAPGAKPLNPRTISHGIGIVPSGETLWVTSMLDNSVSVFSLPDFNLCTLGRSFGAGSARGDQAGSSHEANPGSD